MVLSTRTPNRRRFKSTIRNKQKRKREYFYSTVTVLAVKVVLVWFLCVLLYISTRLFYSRLSDNPNIFRLAIPAVILVTIIVVSHNIYKNIKEIKAQSKNQD